MKSTDEREDGVGKCSFVWRLGDRKGGRGRWCWENKAKRWGEGGEQAHLYVWLPSVKRSATPGLINSEKKSQSFFSPHSGAHGLAMTFTSFETKSGSRYSTLQWADMLRCCHPAWQPQGEKEMGRKVADTCFMLWNHHHPFLMTFSVEKVVLTQSPSLQNSKGL